MSTHPTPKITRQEVRWIPLPDSKTIDVSGRPARLWTLYGPGRDDPAVPPQLPITPVHHHGAFLEDETHDWIVRGNTLRYFSRVTDRGTWVLLEYEDAPPLPSTSSSTPLTLSGLLAAVETARGNRQAAARALGLPLRTFHRRVDELGREAVDELTARLAADGRLDSATRRGTGHAHSALAVRQAWDAHPTNREAAARALGVCVRVALRLAKRHGVHVPRPPRSATSPCPTVDFVCAQCGARHPRAWPSHSLQCPACGGDAFRQGVTAPGGDSDLRPPAPPCKSCA